MAQARERLAGARGALSGGHNATAVSEAYYAMLYAVRAALSEEDLYGRTHGGLWALFHQTFVATERFDVELHALAHAIQAEREGVDYGARAVEVEQAERIVDVAGRFVAAVERMLEPR